MASVPTRTSDILFAASSCSNWLYGMVSTWVKRSHRNWIRITPRKAAKMYQVANWCLRSSGSLSGFFDFRSAVLSRLSSEAEKLQEAPTGRRFHVLGRLVEHVGLPCPGAAG
jgi:hypothetical protein